MDDIFSNTFDIDSDSNPIINKIILNNKEPNEFNNLEKLLKNLIHDWNNLTKKDILYRLYEIFDKMNNVKIQKYSFEQYDDERLNFTQNLLKKTDLTNKISKLKDLAYKSINKIQNNYDEIIKVNEEYNPKNNKDFNKLICQYLNLDINTTPLKILDKLDELKYYQHQFLLFNKKLKDLSDLENSEINIFNFDIYLKNWKKYFINKIEDNSIKNKRSENSIKLSFLKKCYSDSELFLKNDTVLINSLYKENKKLDNENRYLVNKINNNY